MSYDLNGAWNDVTGHNSPLFPRQGEDAEERLLNMVGGQEEATFTSTHFIDI